MGAKRIEIRPARSSEAHDLARIQTDAAIEGYRSIFPPAAPKPTAAGLSPEWLGMIADDSVDVLVAVASHPVGVVAIGPSDEAPTRVRIERLYVDPRWWGRGIGAQLHDAGLAAGRERGAAIAELWVLEENVRARSMYERRGWVLDLDRGSIHPAGVAEVLYRRDLTT